MASREELGAALIKAHEAGDVAGATTLAQAIRAMDAQQGTQGGAQTTQGGGPLPVPTQTAPTGPEGARPRLQPGAEADLGKELPLGDLKAAIEAQPWLSKALAGIGTAPAQAYQGLKQLAGGQVDPQDIQNQRSIVGTGPGMAGNIAGNIAMLAAPGGAVLKKAEAGVKLLPKALQWAARFAAVPAEAAAEAAALNPILEGESRSKNAATAAVFTKALQGVGRGMSKLVTPTKAAQKLIDKGADLTVGQATRGPVGYAEDVTASIPYFGRGTVARRQRAEQQIVDMADQRGDPFKDRGLMADEAPIGRGEHFEERAKDFDDAYDEVLSNKIIPVSGLFRTQVGDAARKEIKGVPDHYKNKLEEDLLNFIPEHSGRIGGKTWKDIQSKVRQRIRSFSDAYETSGKYEDKDMAEAYRAVDDNLLKIRNKGMGKEDRARLDEIDTAWAYNTLTKKAAAYPKQEGEHIGVGNLIKAVENMTPNETKILNKGRLQDLTEPAKEVFDTGSDTDAFKRRTSNLIAASALGVGTIMGSHPLAMVTLPAIMGVGALASTKAGSKAMMGRYGIQQRMAEALRNKTVQGAIAAESANQATE